MSLADALEAAAAALPAHEDAIRPANGDPERVLAALDAGGAVAVLQWLLDERPDEGEELALAWVEQPAGVEALAALDETQLGKAGRKALRRIQHRLRSRGVAVATAAPAAPHVATLPKLDDALEHVLVSPPDPSGAQLVVLIEAAPSGGARVFQGAADVEHGVLEFRVLQATRSQARRLARDLATSDRLAAVPVSREAFAALLARAATAQPADRVLPSGFSEWRARIARPPEGTETPGGLARAALAAEPTPAVLREVAESVRSGALGPWPPSFAALRELADKVRDTAKSPLLVDEAQRRAQVEAVLEDSVGTLFGGARAEALAARFEETAFAWWRRGREAEARGCIAAARAFRELAPAENPVARALLDRAVGPLLRALEEQDAAAASAARS